MFGLWSVTASIFSLLGSTVFILECKLVDLAHNYP